MTVYRVGMLTTFEIDSDEIETKLVNDPNKSVIEKFIVDKIDGDYEQGSFSIKYTDNLFFHFVQFETEVAAYKGLLLMIEDSAKEFGIKNLPEATLNIYDRFFDTAMKKYPEFLV